MNGKVPIRYGTCLSHEWILGNKSIIEIGLVPGTVPICKFYTHHIDADPDANPDSDY